MRLPRLASPSLSQNRLSAIIAAVAVFGVLLHFCLPAAPQGACPTLLLPTVVLLAWSRGFASGLLATLLGTFATMYFFLPPLYSFRVADPVNWLHLGVFAATGLFLSVLAEMSTQAFRENRAWSSGEHAREQELRSREQQKAALREQSLQLSAFLHEAVEAPLRSLLDEACHGARPGSNREEREELRKTLSGIMAAVEQAVLYTGAAGEAPECTAVDCEAIVDEVLARFSSEIESQHVTIVRGALPQVNGTREDLTRVWECLMRQALECRAERPRQIRISAARQGSQWVCSVADNGWGIPLVYQEEVFRLGRHAPGMAADGMGLALCRRLVERHGGRLWVRSFPGQGATFRFSAPDSRDAP